MLHLSYAAAAASHRGVDLFAYTAPTGENLALPARYLSYYPFRFGHETVITNSGYANESGYTGELSRKWYLPFFDVAANVYKGDPRIARALNPALYTDEDREAFETPFFGMNHTQSMVSWKFMLNGISEGWGPLYNISGFRVVNGEINLTTLGADSYISAENLNLQAAEYSKVRIKIRINSPTPTTTIMRFFWYGGTDAWFSSEKRNAIRGTADGVSRWYELNMKGWPGWSGQVKAIRIDPGTIPNVNVAIDEVQLVR